MDVQHLFMFRNFANRTHTKLVIYFATPYLRDLICQRIKKFFSRYRWSIVLVDYLFVLSDKVEVFSFEGNRG